MSLPSPWTRQHGLSLVELMVAMLIGMVVVAGVAALYAGLRGTAAAQDKLGELHESERFALAVVPQFARLAGFRPDPAAVPSNVAFPAEYNPDFGDLAEGQALVATQGRGTASDTLTVRFLADGSGIARDCMGNGSYARGELVTSRLLVSRQRLMCKVGALSAQPLADQVARMDILYAVDAAAGCGGCDRRYMAADEVTAAQAWDRVSLLRIGLSFVVPTGQPPTLQWQQNVARMNP